MNFIRRHIVEKIYEKVKQKQILLKHEHFFYFDQPVQNGSKKIDRVNRWSPYYTDEILPQSFYALESKSLLEIYNKITNNSFFIYKNFGTKSHKVRIED